MNKSISSHIWFFLIFVCAGIHSAIADICLPFPVLKTSGDSLVLNDGSNRRFFLSGMVDNRPSSGEQLSRYNHDEMESELLEHRSFNGTALRWNAFLKGLDFQWDANGNITGLKPGCLWALRDGLDLAKKHGILIQIVLSTAHFAKYGWGGADNELGGIRNGDRVANNLKMMSTQKGIADYISNVIDPMIDSIGQHPALMGYLISNEAYGMIDPRDTDNGSWSDEFIRLVDMQRFVNRVATRLKERQPGVLLSVSGIAKLKSWWDDSALIAAGNQPNGTMDLHQYQYYPKNHKETYSPFQNDLEEMISLWGGSSKPVIVGEFPVEGLESTSRNSVPMTPSQAYEALWDNGYSGGFTWSNLVYTNQSEDGKNAIDVGYRSLYENHLVSTALWDFSCETTTLFEGTSKQRFVGNSAHLEHLKNKYDLQGRQIP